MQKQDGRPRVTRNSAGANLAASDGGLIHSYGRPFQQWRRVRFSVVVIVADLVVLPGWFVQALVGSICRSYARLLDLEILAKVELDQLLPRTSLNDVARDVLAANNNRRRHAIRNSPLEALQASFWALARLELRKELARVWTTHPLIRLQAGEQIQITQRIASRNHIHDAFRSEARAAKAFLFL